MRREFTQFYEDVWEGHEFGGLLGLQQDISSAGEVIAGHRQTPASIVPRVWSLCGLASRCCGGTTVRFSLVLLQGCGLASRCHDMDSPSHSFGVGSEVLLAAADPGGGIA